MKPLRTPLDGTGLQRSATWTDSGTAGVQLAELVDSLTTDNAPYHWRLRVRYDPATTPWARHSRWLTLANNGVQETDLRSGFVVDSDGDGVLDGIEVPSCTGELDLDSDDDGLADGSEDANHTGVVDAGETNPCSADSDGDGIQDGTESGVTTGVADPDGAGSLLGTDTGVFIPDADSGTTTDPLDADTDDDSYADGVEDANQNGALDTGESDPANVESFPAPVQVPALAVWQLALLALLLLGSMNIVRQPDRQVSLPLR